MKIELKPMPQDPEGGTVVGTLDGRPLVYRERYAYVDGERVPHGDLAEALVDAVDRAATAVLGGEWSKPLARVTGLNQRTCNRDRIRQWGLPPAILVLLAQAAADPNPRMLGYFLEGIGGAVRLPWKEPDFHLRYQDPWDSPEKFRMMVDKIVENTMRTALDLFWQSNAVRPKKGKDEEPE